MTTLTRRLGGIVTLLGLLAVGLVLTWRPGRRRSDNPDDAPPPAPATDPAATHRADGSTLVALGGLGALVLLTHLLQVVAFEAGQPLEPLLERAALLFAAAVMAVRGLARRIEPSAEPSDGQPPARVRLRLLWLPLLGGVALLGGVTAVNVGWLPPLHVHGQMLLLVGGAALVTRGLGGRSSDGRQPTSFLERHRREIRLVVLVLLLAFGVRAWQVGNAVRWYVDEFIFVETALLLDETPTQPLLQPHVGLSSIVWAYPYLQQQTIALLGADLAGLRAPSVVLGTLTVLAVYLLGRDLFNRRVALVAALMLATFPPHVHFSRLALYNIADPLFGTLSLFWLARALRRGGQGNYALAGVCLGAVVYFYEGGRVFYPALAAAWLVMIVVTQQLERWLMPTGGVFQPPFRVRGGGLGVGSKQALRTVRSAQAEPPRQRAPHNPNPARLSIRGLIVMGLTALLVAAPLFTTITLAGGFVSRAEQIGGLRLADLAQFSDYWIYRIRPALLHFIHHPDESGWHYGGETALLLRYTAPLALFGLVLLLWRPRHRATPLLLLWLALTIMGNSLLDFVGFTARYVVAFPALALLVAVGLDRVRDLLPSRSGLVVRPLRLAWGTLVMGVAAGQLIYYFGVHLPFYNDILRPYPDYVDVIYRSLDFPPNTRIVVIPEVRADVWTPDHVLLAAFLDLPAPVPIVTPAHTLSPEWPVIHYQPDMHYAFFIEPFDLATYNQLREWFDLMPPVLSPYNVPRDAQYVLLFALNDAADPPTFTAEAEPDMDMERER